MFYLSLDGVSNNIVVPYPQNVKYLKLKVKRNNGDTGGYLYDLRTAIAGYCADTAEAGYSDFQIDGVDNAPSKSNVPDIPGDHVADLLITLINPTSISGNMTIGSRYTGSSDLIDWLTMDVHDIVMLDSNNNILQSFDWSTGSGNTLYSTTGAGNGTINGATWVSDTSTTTVDSGPITMSATGALSAQSTRIQKSNVNMSAVGDLSAQAIRIINASTVMQAVGAMVVEVGNVTIIDSGPISMSATSSLAAKATRLVNERVSMAGNSGMTAKANRMILAHASMQAESTLSAQGLRIVAVSADLVAQGAMDVVMGAELIGTIELTGQRELYVYLVGQRELNVNLKGVI